ncbi:MAG: ATP-grasp domain-containing protein [Blastocatellia bacterium]|nr:ATP-grasp domain-containing protein [Blastocatellia bacterium]
MPVVQPDALDIFLLEEILWLAHAETGLTVYDFPFERFFPCRRPWERPERLTAIGRFGVTTNYAELYEQLAATGVELIHTPAQYLRASELTEWYPLLSDLTPNSVWFAVPPSLSEVEQHFQFPVFVKGSRQTSRHNAVLSIVRTPEQLETVTDAYCNNPILQWQSFVCREFVPLRKVSGETGEKIPPSFEFRTFWWFGECVGAGPYWAAAASYQWTKAEEVAALAVARTAAARLQVPFLVVDVAQTQEGRWIVIECNDGQESGYAGVSPFALWHAIVQLERSRHRGSA